MQDTEATAPAAEPEERPEEHPEPRSTFFGGRFLGFPRRFAPEER